MQHQARGRGGLRGRQRHIQAEHNGAQLVPEVGFILEPELASCGMLHPARLTPAPAWTYSQEGSGCVADRAMPAAQVQAQGGVRLLRFQEQCAAALAGLLPVQL